MAVRDILWFVNRIRKQRQDEADAIAKSAKTPRARKR